MIQLSTLMWWMAIFFGIIGFLRGWKKEIIASAGIVLMVFAEFQFDSLMRGTLFLALPPGQIFFIQSLFLFGVVFLVYQARDIGGAHIRKENDWQAGLLGSLMGAFNGYLIGGALWYFLDINEYPWENFFIAPTINSPAAQSINLMPMVLFGGGSGDVLALGVLVLLFFALVVA
ncbi:MAG: hypothetical protein Q9P01_05840 [Anaerolineae bacterium]|nr:hypothetical protein [Anaerolineae bacterium]MDQ7034358.1 hypothetical protein [Anaerolineae bacterium]